MAVRLQGVRVVFVLNWPVLGGSERQALLLARHLVEIEGASVEVRALTDREGRASELFRAAGVPWHGRRMRWSPSKARTLAALSHVAADLRRLRPDVLLPYCGPPNVVCGLVWRLTGAQACIWNQRDTLPFSVGPRIVRQALRSTPVLVSNSRHAAEHLETRWGVEPGRVRVIPNGVVLPPARHPSAWWRDQVGARATDVVVIALAHLVEVKDHVTLLRAWKVACERLGEREHSGLLVLAGRPGGMQDELEWLSHELGIADRVRFAGDVEDVAGLVRASDIGVLSSVQEGCPNALLECMAGGLAVAGTDVPGIREVAGDDGVPFLAQPGDHEALGAALARLALDPALRTRQGVANRRRVEERFAHDRVLDATVALIAQALEAGAARRWPAFVQRVRP